MLSNKLLLALASIAGMVKATNMGYNHTIMKANKTAVNNSTLDKYLGNVNKTSVLMASGVRNLNITSTIFVPMGTDMDLSPSPMAIKTLTITEKCPVVVQWSTVFVPAYTTIADSICPELSEVAAKSTTPNVYEYLVTSGITEWLIQSPPSVSSTVFASTPATIVVTPVPVADSMITITSTSHVIVTVISIINNTTLYGKTDVMSGDSPSTSNWKMSSFSLSDATTTDTVLMTRSHTITKTPAETVSTFSINPGGSIINETVTNSIVSEPTSLPYTTVYVSMSLLPQSLLVFTTTRTFMSSSRIFSATYSTFETFGVGSSTSPLQSLLLSDDAPTTSTSMVDFTGGAVSNSSIVSSVSLNSGSSFFNFSQPKRPYANSTNLTPSVTVSNTSSIQVTLITSSIVGMNLISTSSFANDSISFSPKQSLVSIGKLSSTNSSITVTEEFISSSMSSSATLSIFSVVTVSSWKTHDILTTTEYLSSFQQLTVTVKPGHSTIKPSLYRSTTASFAIASILETAPTTPTAQSGTVLSAPTSGLFNLKDVSVNNTILPGPDGLTFKKRSYNRRPKFLHIADI